jgi:hypothetical protein
MATTFTKIASVSVGSGGSANIDFTSIPQTYTDLCVKVSSRDTYSAAFLDVFMQLAGVTSSVYTYRRVIGNGTTASSSSGTDVNIPIAVHPGATATAGSFANYEIYIPNYTSAFNKSVSVDTVGDQNATLSYNALYTGIMSNTSAVTSIKILCQTSFAQYSTATLYGIKNS